jgi:hypothetical protein
MQYPRFNSVRPKNKLIGVLLRMSITANDAFVSQQINDTDERATVLKQQ